MLTDRDLDAVCQSILYARSETKEEFIRGINRAFELYRQFGKRHDKAVVIIAIFEYMALSKYNWAAGSHRKLSKMVLEKIQEFGRDGDVGQMVANEATKMLKRAGRFAILEWQDFL